MLTDVRALLSELERAPLPAVPGRGPALPEAALAAIASLRRRIDPPVAAGRLDEALEAASGGPEGVALPQMEANASEEHDELSEDEVMGELDQIDEENEAELAAIARRLKRARYITPY